MVSSRMARNVSVAALCLTFLVLPSLGSAQNAGEKAIATRQGYMKIVLWEAGPLFGMAKGNVAYDASAAQSHAANLKTISDYPVEALFLAGTSTAEHPGKSRSLPKIWQDQSGFDKAFADWRKAVAALGGQVGNGQPALAAAVSEMGKTCGGCHKPYRQEE